MSTPKQKLEEGGPCPCCGGKLKFPPPENCSCHINPPCSSCTSVVLTCEDCGWEDGMEIERGIDPSDRSDTPETDAAVFDIPNYGADGTGSRVAVVHYQVAVRLERERDAARARVAELEAQHEKYQAIVFKARDILKCGHIDNMASSLQTLCNRYNDAQAQIATLEAECERLKHERNRAGMDARKEMMDELAKLKDPVAVHINMLRGTIATPSPEAVEYAKALNRRVDVENVLYQVAAGKREPLTPDECRELANKLGVSPA